MSKPAVIITDHCLVRYVERVLGFDLDKARADILKIVTPAVGVGATKIASGGCTYLLRGNTVTTIIPGSTPNGAHMNAIKHNGTSVRVQRGRV